MSAYQRRLLYLSDPIPAEEGYRLGLLDELVAESELDERVDGLTTRLAEGPTQAYAFIKQSLFLGMAPQLFASLLIEEEFTRVSLETEDAREGSQAMEERRPPHFTGR